MRQGAGNSSAAPTAPRQVKIPTVSQGLLASRWMVLVADLPGQDVIDLMDLLVLWAE
jgi:hypothetical protein